MTQELRKLRKLLRELVRRSQREIVSHDGLSPGTKTKLIDAWGKLWTSNPELELDVSWVFNGSPKTLKLEERIETQLEVLNTIRTFIPRRRDTEVLLSQYEDEIRTQEASSNEVSP